MCTTDLIEPDACHGCGVRITYTAAGRRCYRRNPHHGALQLVHTDAPNWRGPWEDGWTDAPQQSGFDPLLKFVPIPSPFGASPWAQ